MQLPINYDEASWQERRDARNEYIRLQGGCCCHCNKPLEEAPNQKVRRMTINKRLFPKTFFDYPVHLHHCHKSGMTIGAVHNLCNAVLWQYHGE